MAEARSKMKRRGFFRFLGGIAAVVTAIGIHPKLLAPVKKVLTNEDWHHIAVTYDVANASRFYIDGVQVCHVDGEVHHWNEVLTDAQITDLADDVSPMRILTENSKGPVTLIEWRQTPKG